MLQVELIYDANCPQVNAARNHLLRAFVKANLPPQWQEWEKQSPQSPAYAKTWRSPTILINGQAVVDGAEGNQTQTTHGSASLPSLATLIAKLKASSPIITTQSGKKVKLIALFTTLPSIVLALLPKFICPVCWPAYAGLLSVLGVSLTHYQAYLLPATIIFLLITLIMLGVGAKYRKSYKPFRLGCLAAGTTLVGKFWLDSQWLLYSGILLLIIASLWNSWPRKPTPSNAKPSCIRCLPPF